MARPLAFSALLVLIFVLVGCDHATKVVARAELSRSGPVTLVPNVLELRYVENDDTAFSLTRGLGERVKVPLLAIGGALGLLGVGVLASRRLRVARPAERIALACLVAGAVGNVAERLWRGSVIDFIYVHHWPVFNVADILIVAGMAGLALEHYASRARAARQQVS